MFVLQVTGMGCGSCVSKITNAIQQLDATATVEVEREVGRVVVESCVSAEQINERVNALGFSSQVAA
mgnify:CR=1 FL=1